MANSQAAHENKCLCQVWSQTIRLVHHTTVQGCHHLYSHFAPGAQGSFPKSSHFARKYLWQKTGIMLLLKEFSKDSCLDVVDIPVLQVFVHCKIR